MSFQQRNPINYLKAQKLLEKMLARPGDNKRIAAEEAVHPGTLTNVKKMFPLFFSKPTKR